jgi:uncharacterized membrane protein
MRADARDKRPRSTFHGGCYLTNMAAVLLLVLLPITVAVGFMAGNLEHQLSGTTVAAILVFLMLAGALLRGTWAMAKEWDADQ